jgi:predicted ester cyclase
MFTHTHRFTIAVLVIVLVLGLTAVTVMAQGGKDTSPEQNKALIAEYFNAISGKEKTDELQQKYIADSDQVLKDHIVAFEAGFPLYELIAEDMIAEGDKVVVRATFRGTHQGEFAGIPATGISVEMPLIIIYRVEDGKIVEHWMQADVMGLMQQLGALPTPESTE